MIFCFEYFRCMKHHLQSIVPATILLLLLGIHPWNSMAQVWNSKKSTGYYEWNFPNFQFYSHSSSDEDPWIYTKYLKRFRGFGTGFEGGIISRCIGSEKAGLHLGLGLAANAHFVEASWSETQHIRHNNKILEGTTISGHGGMVALTANIAPSALAAFRAGDLIAGVKFTADKNLFYWMVTNPMILRSSVIARYKNHSIEAGIASPGNKSPYKHSYFGIHTVLWEFQSFGVSFEKYHSSAVENGTTRNNDFRVLNIHLGWLISGSID